MRQDRRWLSEQRKVDSKWEAKLRDGLLKTWEFHNADRDVCYVINKTYQSDFVKKIHDTKVIYLEAKGRFRDREEASKYLWVRKSLDLINEASRLSGEPVVHELVFLFYNPNLAFPHAKKRKDGTKMTHKEWAEKQGFRWFSEETLPREW